MQKTTLVLLLLVVIPAVFIAGCTQQQQVQATPQPTAVQPADTIRMAGTTLGTILVDAQGKTLYYFAKDLPAGSASSCSGQCAATWPAFSVDTITVSPPLSAADFSSITRADGKKQTTYRGWPLYSYQADTKAGDVNGENVNKVWFVVKPDETIMVASQESPGSFLTDRTGKTLYYFTKDTAGASACTGACLTKWPAFSADPVSAPSLLKPADITSLLRADGVKQTAYMGRPLYYFADDAKPGDMKGQGFNTVWYVANVSGITPVVTTPPTTLPTTVPTTVRTTIPSGGEGGGGGGGY